MLIKRKNDGYDFFRGVYNATTITVLALIIGLTALNLYRFFRVEEPEPIAFADPLSGEETGRCLVLLDELPSNREPRYRVGEGKECLTGIERPSGLE